jgi:hypothetical protein
MLKDIWNHKVKIAFGIQYPDTLMYCYRFFMSDEQKLWIECIKHINRIRVHYTWLTLSLIIREKHLKSWITYITGCPSKNVGRVKRETISFDIGLPPWHLGNTQWHHSASHHNMNTHCPRNRPSIVKIHVIVNPQLLFKQRTIHGSKCSCFDV